MLVPNQEGAPHIQLSDSEFTIGRSNKCSFRVNDSHISGTHLTITFQQMSRTLTLVSLTDHSSNGTFLNRIRVRYCHMRVLLASHKAAIQVEKNKRYFLKHLDEVSLVYPQSVKWGFSFIDLSFAERSEHNEIKGRYDLHENIGRFHSLWTFHVLTATDRRRNLLCC